MGASCLRINPGNIGSKERILEVIKAAKDNNCSIRIGVNAGSLDKSLLEKYGEPCPEALVESAKYNIKLFEDNDFFNFKISVKSSDIFLTVKAYKKLSKICNYPLHLGVTEAGGLFTGSIKSSIGIGQLLMDGIGDTIRVSLSSDPVDEVKAGYEILKIFRNTIERCKYNFLSIMCTSSFSCNRNSKRIRKKIISYYKTN